MALKNYIKESYNELVNKVSWPTWKELQSSSIVVMIAAIIIAAVVWVMDLGFSHLMQDVVYNILGS